MQQLLYPITSDNTADNTTAFKLKAVNALVKDYVGIQANGKGAEQCIKMLYDLLGAILVNQEYYIYKEAAHPEVLEALKQTCSYTTQIKFTKQHTITGMLNPNIARTKKRKRKGTEQPTTDPGRIRNWNLGNENERKQMIVGTVRGPQRQTKVSHEFKEWYSEYEKTWEVQKIIKRMPGKDDKVYLVQWKPSIIPRDKLQELTDYFKLQNVEYLCPNKIEEIAPDENYLPLNQQQSRIKIYYPDTVEPERNLGSNKQGLLDNFYEEIEIIEKGKAHIATL